MAADKSGFFAFDDFRLDPAEMVLYHADEPVQLKPKAVETLIELVEKAGEVVSKTDLMNAVWRDTFVEENNLSVNIYEIRKALAAWGGKTTYIQTVPRRGFRFVVPVVRASKPDAALVVPVDAGDVSVVPKHARPAVHRFSDRQRLISATLLMVLFCVTIGASVYRLRVDNQDIAAIEPGVPDRPAHGTNNIEAYQLYLRGHELWKTRSNPKMEEGIGFFRHAIELDPAFVAPYLGIADSLSMMHNDSAEWRQAEEYAKRAYDLAPRSAEVHATLGFIHAMNKWQWQAAEDYFLQALTLDPNSGKAHQWYANLLMIERRFDEAEQHLKKAIEIEPLSPNYNCDLCELYAMAGRDDDAMKQCRLTNKINPDFNYANNDVEILFRHGRYEEAAEGWLQAYIRAGVPEKAVRDSAWYRGFKANGFRGWMLADLEAAKSHPDALLGVWNASVTYARLRDSDKTIEYLEKAYTGRSFLLPYVSVRREFDFLRDDPRFHDLLRRMNFRPAR